MRKSSYFIGGIVGGLALLSSFLLHAAYRQDPDNKLLEEQAEFVRKLGLADLCLFTEARYTRHPAQADFHAAFQDSPLSLEHFPSGSLLAPPPGLKERHAALD